MPKTKVREILIKNSQTGFLLFPSKESYDFDGLSSLKKLLSKEKAKILDCVKYKNPGSIYELSKLLKRPFKAVFDDVRILERFGFIQIKKEKENNRIKHKPVILVDELIINFKI